MQDDKELKLITLKMTPEELENIRVYMEQNNLDNRSELIRTSICEHIGKKSKSQPTIDDLLEMDTAELDVEIDKMGKVIEYLEMRRQAVELLGATNNLVALLSKTNENIIDELNIRAEQNGLKN